MSSRFTFGPFVLDLVAGHLTRDGVDVPLQPLTFQLLVEFATHPGALLSRDDLMRTLWPDTAVTDDSLTQLVRRARKALAPHDYVTTEPRRGYRFTASVRDGSDAAPVASGPSDGTIGRTHEIATVRAHLEASSAPVTLLGPGGIGKTRIARRMAAHPPADLATTFLDLSVATVVDDVVRAVRDALGITDARSTQAQLARALADRPAQLWILDNLEQLEESLRPLLDAWRTRAPQHRWLLTSRVALGVADERVVVVPPLSTEEAGALLHARGSLPADDPGLPELLAALDGVPLAIELVAPRTRILSASALAAQLRSQSQQVMRTSTPATPRHGSLQASFDASWNRLDPALRTGLVQLAVTRGPFTFDDATALLDADLDPLETVQALSDQSWLTALPDRSAMQLLVPVRDYVVEVGAPDARSRAESRHGAHWAWPLDRRRAADRQSNHEPDFARLRLGLPDVIAAHQRALARGDGPVVVATAATAWVALTRVGPLELGRTLLEQALPFAHDHERFRLLIDLGASLRELGHASQALPLLEDALTWSRTEGTELDVALAAVDMAMTMSRLGRPQDAFDHCRIAVDIYASLPPSHNAGIAQMHLGIALVELGQADRGVAELERARATFQADRSLQGEGVVCGNLAIMYGMQGDTAAALASYDRAIEVAETQGRLTVRANELGHKATLLGMQGRMDEAAECLEEALAQVRHDGHVRAEGLHLMNLGWLHHLTGHPDGEAELQRAIRCGTEAGDDEAVAYAWRLLAAVAADRGRVHQAHERLDRALQVLGTRSSARLLAAVRTERGRLHLDAGELPRAGDALVEAEGLARKVGDHFALFFALATRARVEGARGMFEAARSAEAEARALAEKAGWTANPAVAEALATALDAVS